MAHKATTSTPSDYGTHAEFYDYYAEASISPSMQRRFRIIRDTILRLDPSKDGRNPCDILDVGCNAGTQSQLWAELGHRVRGLDINGPLLDLARDRAAQNGYNIEFLLGSATSLPLPDRSVDVCLAAELLEHVADWQSCIKEFVRVLRPGGVLYMSTTNKLCPIQQEFNLPLYSWYPGPLKRYYERLAVTTRPEIANHAKYPAVNWFTFFGLRSMLAKHGFRSLDRFDAMDLAAKGTAAKIIVQTIRNVPPLRWLAHIGTEGTSLVAIRSS
jgi:ubiquinone/menaquinone biosynthesis C-methylase UbiE